MQLHTVDQGVAIDDRGTVVPASHGGSELHLDSDVLIDIPWAESMERAGALNFTLGIRADATVPIARDLNYVLAHVREHYRPGKYVEIALQNVPIPDWADSWETSKITHTGSVQLSSQVGRQDIVTGDFSRDTVSGRMFEIVNGYKYWRREMVKAAKLGVDPSAERALAQARAAEDFLDALIATGLAGSQYGAGGALDMGLGLTGIANDANVIASGILLGANKAGGDSAWQDATGADFDLVLTDLHKLVSAVYTRSKERHKADLILMPEDEFDALNRLRPVGYAANVLSTFETEWSKRLGRQGRIVVWDKFAALGTVATGPRIVALDSKDANVVARMTGKEYGVDQVREVTRGWEANASLVTGGVRILDSSGLVYMDLNPGA